MKCLVVRPIPHGRGNGGFCALPRSPRCRENTPCFRLAERVRRPGGSRTAFYLSRPGFTSSIAGPCTHKIQPDVRFNSQATELLLGSGMLRKAKLRHRRAKKRHFAPQKISELFCYSDDHLIVATSSPGVGPGHHIRSRIALVHSIISSARSISMQTSGPARATLQPHRMSLGGLSDALPSLIKFSI
jgi:hypothetical protein